MKPRLKVREIAEARGISRTRLHHDSEVAYGTIRKVFQDPYTDITMITASRLAYALGVRTGDVVEDVEDAIFEAETREIKQRKREQ